ncbi:hypothetical protein ASE83_16100 [Sphingomonas sp. Leaf32]|nr:hypothetical protein ASE83_16100 [Sphingomonas sp. Leaf32]
MPIRMPAMVSGLAATLVWALASCSATDADPQAASNASAAVAVILVIMIYPWVWDVRRRSPGSIPAWQARCRWSFYWSAAIRVGGERARKARVIAAPA